MLLEYVASDCQIVQLAYGRANPRLRCKKDRQNKNIEFGNNRQLSLPTFIVADAQLPIHMEETGIWRHFR